MSDDDETSQRGDGGPASDKRKGGQFFAVDKQRWIQVCNAGLNEAVAYLVLACFSGKTNANTAASVHALETYTGISRSRAKEAIDSLKTLHLIRQTRGGSHPRYDLLPPGQHGTGGPKSKPGEAAADNWIWLPNTLVTGAASECPPVESVRQTQKLGSLRLFVELYDASNLRDDGGISRRLVFRKYHRERLGQQAGYVVWGFIQDCDHVFSDAPHARPYKRDLTVAEKSDGKNQSAGFWETYRALETLGLIETVSYLWESEDDDAEPMHPYQAGPLDCIETRIGLAAHQAGAALLTPGQVKHASAKGLWLAPVREHRERVAMVGIKRLRYRPKTRKTGAWWAELQRTGAKWLDVYQRVIAERTDATQSRSA